jgi:hypothetical protein
MSPTYALLSYVAATFCLGKADVYRAAMAHDKLVWAIAEVETGGDNTAIGDNGRAYTAWQLHDAAFRDGNAQLKKEGRMTYPWCDLSNPKNARAVASAYVRLCVLRLTSAGVKDPSPEQIYLCYSMGFKAYKDAGFKSVNCPPKKIDAAVRVGNLFRQATR